MRTITVAATQMPCSWDEQENIQRAESLIRAAASQGAQIILMQELFLSPYFCKDINNKHFSLAKTYENNTLIQFMQTLARELKVVLPISYFEKAEGKYFNSLCMIDADGELLGNYRKSHIPSGPGYEEKFYFSPGDTGFKVWETQYGCVGVGICWDQWFPEAARIMALQGAELLFYPTAIGSEPHDPSIDSMAHWQRVMQGHAGANMVPVIASNRIGCEIGESCELTFYGSSFISDETGKIIKQADRASESVLVHEFDLNAVEKARKEWAMFEDRRPALYKLLSESVEKY